MESQGTRGACPTTRRQRRHPGTTTADALKQARRAEVVRLEVARLREVRLGAAPPAAAATGTEVLLSAVAPVADRPVEVEVAPAEALPVGRAAPWGRAGRWTLSLWPCSPS